MNKYKVLSMAGMLLLGMLIGVFAYRYFITPRMGYIKVYNRTDNAFEVQVETSFSVSSAIVEPGRPLESEKYFEMKGSGRHTNIIYILFDGLEKGKKIEYKRAFSFSDDTLILMYKNGLVAIYVFVGGKVVTSIFTKIDIDSEDNVFEGESYDRQEFLEELQRYYPEYGEDVFVLLQV